MDDVKRAQEAKERAEGYVQPQTPQADEERRTGPRSESEWTDIVGQRIEQAMREGAFDNLPGRGQPLNLTKDPFVPDDQQMAFKLLQNNDLKPAWISERNALMAEVTQFRSTIAAIASWHKRQRNSTTDPAETERLVSSWENQINDWASKIADINRRIETLNLQQPVAQLEIIKLSLDNELSRVGAKRNHA